MASTSKHLEFHLYNSKLTYGKQCHLTQYLMRNAEIESQIWVNSEVVESAENAGFVLRKCMTKLNALNASFY